MKDLNIPGTQSTPAITADPARGLLTMRGDSYPENSFELFGPVIEWVESYLLGASAPLNLELELLYLNTSSIKSMMDIFDVLESAHGKAARLASPGSTTCATSASANWPRIQGRLHLSLLGYRPPMKAGNADLDQRIAELLADPAHVGHPLREALRRCGAIPPTRWRGSSA